MSRFKRAIVVGASSGIGAELGRQLAAAGCRVALLARRAEELRTLAEEINQAHPDPQPRALVYSHDVRCHSEIAGLFQEICRDLDGLDLFIYSSGVMPRLVEDEYNFEKDQQMIEVNISGAVGWLNEAGQRFQQTGAGTIVGIGSVAGDRGRRGQLVYGASKAFMETYLEALRNRVGRHKVRVVTIKPGPVETPMTAGLKLPLMITAPEAARQILRAAEKGRRVVYVPWQWRYLMGVIRAIPSPIFQKLNL